MFEMTLFAMGLLLGLGVGYGYARIKASLREKEIDFEKKSLEEKVNFLQKIQNHTLEQFKGVSAEALQQSQQAFFQLAQATFEKHHTKVDHALEKKEQTFNEMIKPVKESLEKVDHKIAELEKAREGAYSGLKEQLVSLMDTQKQLRTETASLVRALRAPSVRGRWGEIQLKRVVELAGMLDHCDFYEQTNQTVEERRFRPDLLVKLPGGKNIIVDAKVPLEAYLEAIDCQDEDKKREKMCDHARQVRQHLQLLSRKSYWDQFHSSPEFVVLFLPGEPFFSAALEHDPSLIEVGVEQRVILATPTTLIALLRAVAFGWRQEILSKDVEQISLLGKDLYKRILDMASHWTKLGKSLSGAVDSFNKAVGSLESRVLVTARRFKEFEWVATEKEIDPIEQLEHIPRTFQATELLAESKENTKALGIETHQSLVAED